MPCRPRSAAAPRASGENLFARMLRLWLEHHQRMAEFGMRPL